MKNVWIFNQYNMPPEYGHLNRHYNFGKYLRRAGYNPAVFVGSNLHNSKIQIKQDKCLYKIYENCEYPYVFVKTCDYSKSKLKRVYAMVEFYRNLFKIAGCFEQPDVIIGSSAHPLAAIAAIRLAQKYGCKSIVEVRDLWPESFVAYGIIKRNNPLIKLLYAGEKWIYRKADKLIFTMEGGKDYIVEKGWDKGQGGVVDLNKVFHINNGVDMEVFNYNKKHYVLDDEDLNDDSIFKVIYTGSIRLTNNIDILVEAAKKIWEMGEHNIKLIIYGSGDLLPELKAYIKLENILNVTFKGSVNKKYIPYILSKSNLNILDIYNSDIFRFGISPNKLFDYLASGKPILSGLICNYDVIKQNNCGTTLEVISSDEIAKKIVEYSNMTKYEMDQLENNALIAAGKYDFSNLTKKLIEIIEMR
jgi:glycosyltransferase involved in cell wall biosynthesis